MIPFILIQSTFSIRPGFDHQHHKDVYCSYIKYTFLFTFQMWEYSTCMQVSTPCVCSAM